MEEKKLNKKLLIVGIALLVLLAALITAVVIFTSPKAVALRSIKNFTEDIVKRDEVKPIYKTLKGGSVEVSLDKLIEKDGEDEDDLLDGDYYAGKIYFGKNKLMIDNFDSKIGGTKLEGQLYISDDEIYITEENILDGTYGIKFKDLAKDLKDSIFAPDSGSDYEIPEDVFDSIINALESIDEISKVEKDASKTIKKVYKNVIDIVLKNADISSEKTSVRINGEKTKVRCITISIDGKALSNIVMDLYDYLRDSKEISKFLDEYNDLFVAMFGGFYDTDKYDTFKEVYDEFFENYEDFIDNLCDEIEDEFETLDIMISTPKRSSKLLKLEVEMDGESILSLDCGKKGIKKTDSITLEIADTKITYNVTANNRKAFNAKLVLKTPYDDKYTLEVEIDKKADTYKATYTESDDDDYSDKYIIKGKISTKFKKTTMTVDKVTNKYSFYGDDYECTYDVKSTIVIDQKDKMPKREKNYSTLSDITETDIEKWIKKLEKLDDADN